MVAVVFQAPNFTALIMNIFMSGPEIMEKNTLLAC